MTQHTASRILILPSLLSVLILGLLLAAVRPVWADVGIIKIDGSSTVFPITEAVAEEFQRETRGSVRVTVGISGTGGGFKKFCRGETDVQDASRPITADEMEQCRKNGVQYFELPIGYDALAIVANPKATWIDSITVDELKRMWEPPAQGKIMNWKQVRPSWPDESLKLFGAGSDSGTFDYFTEAIVGKAKASRGDYTASEDDNTLVQGIASDKHAVGYVPFAYYEPNKSRLKLLAVDAGHGAVTPSRAAVENGRYAPLSRPLFIYVKHKSVERPEVKRFVEFYLTNAAALTAQVKYVPLPSAAYEMATKNFRAGKLGTAFKDIPVVGLKIEDVLQREAAL